jgi:uncharacterized protein (DUF1778 family)
MRGLRGHTRARIGVGHGRVTWLDRRPCNTMRVTSMNCKFRYSLISAAIVPDRTALLIHCSAQEAKIIRERAILQRRTISGYVLNVMMRVVARDERLFTELGRLQRWDRIFVWNSLRPVGPRTTLLLRCSVQESARIRLAAKRRGATISAFVTHTLRSSWNLQPSPRAKRPAAQQKAKE